MALSVHELRDIAPGHHGHGAGRFRFGGLADLPFFRKYGGPALRFTFTMIASFSLALLLWSTLMQPKSRAKSPPPSDAADGTSAPDHIAGGEIKPRNTFELINAWLAESTSGALSSFRKSANKDPILAEQRELSEGPGIFNRELRPGEIHGPRTDGNIDPSGLLSGKGQLMREDPVARNGFFAAPDLGLSARPAFREVTPAPERRPVVVAQPPRVLEPMQPRPLNVASESATRAPTPAIRAPQPLQPPAAHVPSAPPAIALATPPAARVDTARSAAAEVAVGKAILLAQSDFREFDAARASVRDFTLKNPSSPVRGDIEAQLATLTETRRQAIVQRTAFDPAKDKFVAADLDDATELAMATCLARQTNADRVIVARKEVDIQPRVPAYFVFASAPGLPRGARSEARDKLNEHVNGCVAGLRKAGTAVVIIGEDAAGGREALARISGTAGAIVWKR